MILSTRTKISIAKLLHRSVRAGRRLVRKPMHGTFVRSGIQWQLDLDEGIDLSIYLMGGFEPATARTCRKIIRQGDVVFDVGANMGAHTLQFARLTGSNGGVHAFEPTLPMLQKLRKNCALNPELGQRVVVNHAFCTYSTLEAIPDSIYSSWPLTGSQVGLHPTHLGRRNTVGAPKLIILDEYAKEQRLSRVDFIKIDVDGYEVAVLKGAQNIMANFKPKILTEVAPYLFKENNEEMETFWSIFRQHGYRMRFLNSNEEVPLASEFFMEKLAEDSSVNVLLY